MDSSIVIKVKHADTLRRFNARVLHNELEFNLDGLREKIRGLFKFSPDADIMLTYLDEDNDEVTLGDDADLGDVVSQSLNPLRISVSLRTGSGARDPSRSDSVVTPLSSSPLHQPLENLNSAVISAIDFFNSLPEPRRVKLTKNLSDLASIGTSSGSSLLNTAVNDIRNSLPEPSRTRVTKLLSDLASTGPSSGQSFAEFVGSFREFLRPPTESGAGSDSSILASAPATENTSNLAEAQEAGSSNVQKLELKFKSNKKHEMLSSKTGASIVNSNPEAITEAQPAPKFQETPEYQATATGEAVKSDGSKESAARFPGLKAVKAALDSIDSKGDGSMSGFTPPNASSALKEKAILDEDASVRKATSSPFVGARTTNTLFSSKKVGFQQSNAQHVPKPIDVVDPSGKANRSPLVCSPTVSNAIPLDNNNIFQKPYVPPVPKPVNVFPFPSPPGYLTWSNDQSNTFNVPPTPGTEWPFSGTSIGNNPAGPTLLPPHEFHSRRTYGYRDGSGIVFHSGVRCDGCGVHPITGTRFKSRVKDNYDLCNICFAEMGIESEYIRIDRPLTYRSPLPLRGFYDFPPRMHHNPQQHVFRGCGVKQSRPKLDSRFIQDVNILDGTIMAPSTPFTKIWRMRNNGSLLWPKGTKLIWIGGDQLSDLFSVELEIATNGFPVDQELDVALDFTAPDRPGRYVSYWRMSSPSGQKFGQRVWVLIQVDANLQALPQGAVRGFNLNLPSVSASGLGPEVLNANTEPLVADGMLNSAVDLVEAVANMPSQKKEELIFPINDSLLVGGGLTSELAPPVSYPIIDMSDISSASSCNAVPPVPAVSVSPSVVVDDYASRPSAGTFVAPPFIDDSDHNAVPIALVSRPIAPAQPFNDVSDPAPVTVASASSSVDVALPVAANEQMSDENDLENSLLNELNRMGFKQVDLNKEVLRSNEYDLEKSLNDLCGVSEWDPILEELHEMGFHDDETNKKLLKKNNGSVTQVVLDLLVDEE